MKLVFFVVGLWSVVMLMVDWKDLKKSNRLSKVVFGLGIAASWGIWTYYTMARNVWYPTVWIGELFDTFLPF